MDSKVEFQKLLTDDKFIGWVKKPNPASDEYWNLFITENPFLKEEFEKAKYVVKRLQNENRNIGKEEIAEIWNSIGTEINEPNPKISRLNKWMLAASIFLLLGVGGIIGILLKNDGAIDYKSLVKQSSEKEDVQLVLADRSTKTIQSKEPSISYTPKGEVLIDSVSIKQEAKKDKITEERFNQLVVPYGKRSSLTLSDGTEIYLNSGSRVIYPVSFSKEKREIYVEGEVFLRVTHNDKWPFHLVTDKVQVEVLGTEFDVKAYKDEDQCSIVLVKGSVQAVAKSKKIMMEEREQLILHHSSGEITQKIINVSEYIAWKDGLMFCNNEKIGSIAATLSRYYNVDIQAKDKRTEELTISGKLDLKSEFTQVLEAICFTAPVKIEENEGKIIISMK
ncbi:FecR family protein [Maribellus maritimus]|uniref:FecR family protein n=1 Tax=Maribellus maritimus TaxID=2870838 RepID=UPI001EEBDB9B|nr:FecR domain-containing protein [Maribellus maritimus]MCG6188597.1 FecR domain-containing protein [Maribellus maritimus]